MIDSSLHEEDPAYAHNVGARPTRATIIWVDLETSGLRSTAKILELAAIATTDDLQEVGRFHRVTNAAGGLLPSDYEPGVLEMHVKSRVFA